MDWRDIPQFPRAHYEIDIEWRYLERHIASQAEYGLDLDPDFQRAHVWTDAQRSAYVEYALKGGEVGRVLTFVCSDWEPIPVPGYAILDGKQRLESVRRFLRGDVRVFAGPAKPEGYAFGEFTGSLRSVQARFSWRVVIAPTRTDILRLYLQINAGGTPHTSDELDRVRGLLRVVEAH